MESEGLYRGLPESKEDEVQGLGKGVDRIVNKKHSSKTIVIEAHSDSRAPITDLPVKLYFCCKAFCSQCRSCGLLVAVSCPLQSVAGIASAKGYG